MATSIEKARPGRDYIRFLETDLEHAVGLARAFAVDAPHTEEGLAMLVKQRLWAMGGRKEELDPVSYKAARKVFETLEIPTLTAAQAPSAAWGWAAKRATAEHC